MPRLLPILWALLQSRGKPGAPLALKAEGWKLELTSGQTWEGKMEGSLDKMQEQRDAPMSFTPLSESLFIKSSYKPLLFSTDKLEWKEIRKRGKGERELHFMAILRIAHGSESSLSTAFCPSISRCRPLLWLANIIYSSPWLEEASSFPMASRIQLLSMHPPNSGGHIFLCLKDTPQFEKLLSPLVPSSSARQLVSGTLDFFTYLPLLRDQQWSTCS